MNDQLPIYEYEQYELICRHYITEGNGRKVQLEEPIVVRTTTTIGAMIPMTVIMHRMIHQLMQLINNDAEK